MWPSQQRYQAPSIWPRKPNSRPVLRADARARRGRQRVPVGVAQQLAVRVDRAGRACRPGGRGRPPACRRRRAAGSPSRRSAAARSGAGTSRSCRCGRRSGRPRPSARASPPSTKPPPARPSSSRPVRARNPRREVAPATRSLSTHCRRAEQRFQLVERVEGALGEHLAVGREHDRVRAARDGERLPGVGVGLLVEELELDLGVAGEQAQRRLERGAERAAGEVKTATASGARRSKRSISPTRPPSSGPSWSSESAACGATASRSSPSSRASASSATASAANADERDGQAERRATPRSRARCRAGTAAPRRRRPGTPSARRRPSRSASGCRSTRTAGRPARGRSRPRAGP